MMTYIELIEWVKANEVDIGTIERMEKVSSLDALKDILLGFDWSCILEMKPELHVYCNWSKLDGEDWRWLLKYQPHFADKCDWSKFNGRLWSGLLVDQPQFADKCDWTKLNSNDWSYLLREQPQLKKYQIKN